MSLISLIVKNIQSWEDLNILFVPGINVIIGDSHQGKTAIMRSLDLLINNRPSIDKLRSWWALQKEEKRGEVCTSKIEAQLKEGITVGRERSKNDNLYWFENEKRGREEFRAFGMNVPPEISNILRISEVNFQSQMDGPYLLSSRPADLGRYLNEIAGLDDINLSFSNIDKWIRGSKSDLKYMKEDLKAKVAEEEQYAQLNDQENHLERLEEMEQKANDREGNLNTLQSLLRSIEREKRKLKEYPQDLEEQIDHLSYLVGRIEELKGKMKKQEEKLSSLQQLLSSIQYTKRSIIQSIKQIKEAEKELKELQPNTCPIYDKVCPLKGNRN